MINSVRNTVLAILNKNNYGYISPQDFNLYAKQAQLELFDEYFAAYNSAINDENRRTSGTGYANMTKQMLEVIDYFSVTRDLPHYQNNQFYLPSTQQGASSTGDDYYLLNKVLCYDITTTPRTLRGEAEPVTHSNITLLNTSLLTAPDIGYPAYTIDGPYITIYPVTYDTLTEVQAQYIRYPFAPKWTYSVITGGEPVFDDSQTDYQDFELSIDDEYILVNKILQQAGMEIRENDVVQYATAQETIQNAQT